MVLFGFLWSDAGGFGFLLTLLLFSIWCFIIFFNKIVPYILKISLKNSFIIQLNVNICWNKPIKCLNRFKYIKLGYMDKDRDNMYVYDNKIKKPRDKFEKKKSRGTKSLTNQKSSTKVFLIFEVRWRHK